jgi:hypothetical protein
VGITDGRNPRYRRESFIVLIKTCENPSMTSKLWGERGGAEVESTDMKILLAFFVRSERG